MQETKQESSDAILARWYQHELDVLRKAKQDMLAAQTTFEVILDNVDSHRKLMPEWQQKSFEVHGYASRTGWSISIELAVDTFKDPVAVGIIDFILHALPGDGKVETNDYASIGHRDVAFEATGISAWVSMRLRGDGSEGCRRVKVGTKTREEPVYEFRCE